MKKNDTLAHIFSVWLLGTLVVLVQLLIVIGVVLGDASTAAKGARLADDAVATGQARLATRRAAASSVDGQENIVHPGDVHHAVLGR